MNQHRTPAPDWQADPVVEARIYLPQSGPLDIPGTLILPENLSPYPAGTLTYFEVVSNPATMTPDRAYVIRLTSWAYVIRPFLALTDGCLSMGQYAGSEQPPLAPIPLAEVDTIYVATRGEYLPYLPPHPFYLNDASQLLADKSLTGRTGYVRDRDHLDCDLHVEVGDESMMPLLAPGTHLLCDRTTPDQLTPGKAYVFGVSQAEAAYVVKRLDVADKRGFVQISSINPTTSPDRPTPGVTAYRIADSKLTEVYRIVGTITLPINIKLG